MLTGSVHNLVSTQSNSNAMKSINQKLFHGKVSANISNSCGLGEQIR